MARSITVDEVLPKTQTVLMALAGLVVIVAFRRFAIVRFALPWIARGVLDRVFYQHPKGEIYEKH